ncbi:hypothetical protein RB195_000833 [Necator americanus]|uniref:Secreted protein n=1 Tax=Necator americanus TaxID=51031 RepID=A0ABR1DCF4_NECAM
MLPLSILFAFGSLGNDVIYCPQNGGKAKENAVVKPLLAQIKNSRLLLLRNRQRNLPDGYPMPMPKSMGVVGNETGTPSARSTLRRRPQCEKSKAASKPRSALASNTAARFLMSTALERPGCMERKLHN